MTNDWYSFAVPNNYNNFAFAMQAAFIESSKIATTDGKSRINNAQDGREYHRSDYFEMG